MKPNFIFQPEVDSTNDRLTSLLAQEKDLPEGTVLFTDFQWKGKGQSGNSWESENGKNLLFSILLRPDFLEIKRFFFLSMVLSLALKDMLQQYLPDISIKWPNDIYYRDKKIVGFLIENSLYHANIASSVVGIGININQDEFKGNTVNPVSMKQITGKEYDRTVILKDFFEFLRMRYEDLKMNRFGQIKDDYINSLFRKDGFYLFCSNNKRFKAAIEDVLDSGPILLRKEDGVVTRYAFKEVAFIV